MTLDQVNAYASQRLDDIRSCFKPGAKLFLAVRAPGYPERDFVLTDDNLDEVMALIERRKAGK